MTGNNVSCDNRRAVAAHRIVQIGLCLALLWKWSFFRFSAAVYQEVPLADPFFPDWLRSVRTLEVSFLVTVGSIALSLWGVSILRKTCAVTALVGASVLCLHQGSYNDATFVTAWWTLLWNLWFVFRLDDEDQAELLRRAAFLSRLIISMILLGGAVGKWTVEYWAGDVLYDIYFRDRNFWFFNQLRESFQPDELREIATWYSRAVIATETMAGFGLWLLPAKWAAAMAIVLLASIALFSNFQLFSVLFSLIGLAAVGFFVAKQAASTA